MSPVRTDMKLLTFTLFVVAAQATHLIPLDVEVPLNPRITGEEWKRLMAAQKPEPENYPYYKRGSVPQSPLAGWTFADVKSRIIGGSQAKSAQFPWQAAVEIDSRGLCGGSLISEDWVLTAAHCVSGRNTFKVILGTVNRIRPETGSQTVTTRYSWIHNSYNPMTLNYDIALLMLPSPINISTYIVPAKLPGYSFAKSLTGVTVRVSGWGRTSNSGLPSDNLNFVDVYGISNEECARHFYVITNRNLCTRGNNGQTACNGDSGGALVYQEDNGRYVQVGIVSFGSAAGCSLAPAAFTRVTSFLQWIETITNIAIDN